MYLIYDNVTGEFLTNWSDDPNEWTWGGHIDEGEYVVSSFPGELFVHPCLRRDALKIIKKLSKVFMANGEEVDFKPVPVIDSCRISYKMVT